MEERTKQNKPRALPLVITVAAVAVCFLLYAWRSRAGLVTPLAIGAVAGAAVALILLLWRVYALLFQKNAPLSRVFVPAALFLGLLFALAFPLGSVPDEQAHADSVYLYTNRILGVDDAPSADAASAVYQEVNTAMRSEDAKERALLFWMPRLSVYRDVFSKAKFWYAEEDRALVPVTLTDIHVSPVLYAPAILGMLLGRTMHLGYYPLLLFCRLCMLLFYVGMTAWALKLLPYGKAALFVAAMMPMALHLSCSLSYDATVLALVFPLFASCIDMAHGAHDRVTWAQVIRVAVLTVAVAACKTGAYLPLLFLLFLIPRDRFARKGQRLLLFFGLLLLALLACALWNRTALFAAVSGEMRSGLVDYETYAPAFLWEQPAEAAAVFLRTVASDLSSWVQGCIGRNLGWLNVPVSRIAVLGFVPLLLGTCLHAADEPLPRLSGAKRLLFLLPPVLTLGCFLVGMLLWWTPAGSASVQGIQGRYFLPVVPCLLLLLPRVSVSGTLHLSEKTKIPVGVHPERTIAFLAVVLAAVALSGLYPMLMAQ